MWWRRTPSGWSRSLLPRRILRDTDNLLRNTEHLLRNRPFSKSQPTSAQQQESKDDPEASGRRLYQDYHKWRREIEKRMVEDPYKMLFGASENRLRGLGFGRGWMEMGMGWMEKEAEKETEDKGREKAATSSNAKRETPNTESFIKCTSNQARSDKDNTTYPKVNITNENVFTKREPTYTAFRLGRSESSEGVASPSDPRRPRDYEHGTSKSPSLSTRDADEQRSSDRQRTRKAYDDMIRFKNEQEASMRKEVARQEAAARGQDFISKFLDNGSAAKTLKTEPVPRIKNPTYDMDWRQTALDRRAPTKPILSSSDVTMEQTKKEIKDNETLKDNLEWQAYQASKWSDQKASTKTTEDKTVVSDATMGGKENAANGIPIDTQTPIPGAQFWPAMSDRAQLNADIASRIRSLHAKEQKQKSSPTDDKAPETTDEREHTPPSSTRSTSDILSKLPKDDIDFLSAADIRAAMGAPKSVRDETSKPRDELEIDFKIAHEKEPELHPMIEAQIVNDKHIRRLEREMKAQQEAKATASEHSASESLLETSLDRLSKMLHEGGDVLTKYMWTDPISANGEQASVKRSHSLTLVGIISNLRQNRTSMQQISQDLENDIPATKNLLKGLRDFESRAIGSVVALSRYPNGPQNSSRSDAQRRYDEASKTLQLIDYRSVVRKQLNEACNAVDSMQNIKLSDEIQERLRTAAEVLQENACSTETMQSDLVIPSARRAGLDDAEPLHQILEHNLQAVRELQVSLLQVVKRVMLRFSVSPRYDLLELRSAPFTPIRSIIQSMNGSTLLSDTSNDTGRSPGVCLNGVKKRQAADEKLEREIQAHKSAMRGLPDDGYTRAAKPESKPSPKPATKKILEEPRPLANSLFRPFGLQLESLGKEEEVVKEERKTTAIEAAKRREEQRKDEALVKEVETAYEDTYGPITVDHRQGAIEEQEIEPGATKNKDSAIVSHHRSPHRSTSTTLLVSAGPGRSAKSTVPTTTAETSSTTDMLTNRSPAPSPYISLSPDTAPPPSPATASETSSSPPNTPTPETSAPVVGTAQNDEPTPIRHKILTYNPSSDELFITTTNASADPKSESVPLPAAFAVLDHPAKFLPHIPAGYTVITAKPDMLILRDDSNTESHTETVNFNNFQTSSPDQTNPPARPNPLTEFASRLSPTDYTHLNPFSKSSPGDIQELNRHMVGGKSIAQTAEEWRMNREMERLMNKERGRRSAASVLKTVVWVGGMCYIVGVVSELVG